MEEKVKEYINKYPIEIVDLYNELRSLVYDSVSQEVDETLWAKLPSYYIGDSFIRLIPFKDHINVEAQGVNQYKDKLTGYKITPKGMLQIYLKQDIPSDILREIFKVTLKG